MNQTHSNPYVQALLKKGYTLSEIQKTKPLTDKRVPAHLRDRYDTYEEYQEAVADFLNGN